MASDICRFQAKEAARQDMIGMFFCKSCNRADLEPDMFFKNNGVSVMVVKTCRDCRDTAKKNYEKNREKKLAYSKKYRKENLQYFSEYRKQWRDDNRTEYNARRGKRLQTDERYRAICKGQSLPRRAVSCKTMTPTLQGELGCSQETFIKHIESQFLEGMNWSNRSVLWEFDHIFPLSRAYDFGPHIFQMATNYQNVRPFWKKQQLKKGFSIPHNSPITDYLQANGSLAQYLAQNHS